MSVMSWQEFVNTATKVADQEGYPVGVLLGQAALETGRNLGNAMGNNFFGIKGGGNAGSQKLRTKEANQSGKFYDTASHFASYLTPEDSIRAYIKLIKERYPEAWKLRYDPYNMLEAIKKGGYATDPQYVDKVMGTPEWRTYADQRVMKNGKPLRTSEYVGESGDFGEMYNEPISPTPSPKKKTWTDQLWDKIFPKADAYFDPTNPGGLRNYSPQVITPFQDYTVKPGDTLWDIADQYGLGGQNFGRIKGYSGSPGSLPIGQHLQIPQQKPVSYSRPTPPPQQSYSPSNANYSSNTGVASYAPPPKQSYSVQPQQPTSQPSAQLNFSPTKATSGYSGASPNNVQTKSGLKLTI